MWKFWKFTGSWKSLVKLWEIVAKKNQHVKKKPKKNK